MFRGYEGDNRVSAIVAVYDNPQWLASSGGGRFAKGNTEQRYHEVPRGDIQPHIAKSSRDI